MSALNAANLFSIRHRKFEHLRQGMLPNSMDNYSFFNSFFDVANHDHITHQNFNKGFKTIFPALSV